MPRHPVGENGETIKADTHAVNVQVPLIDWYRSIEASKIDARFQSGNASDVFRFALKTFLDEHIHAEHITTVATASLEFAQEAEAQRQALRAQLAGE
jgi:hypothetical protein